ncbi:MAG: MMPL family transporter [Fidelibacterota bacterium]|nr:MAG: MMPL family transporter [Candidatus Neomarinimicrobiota bacterium]
MRDRLLTAVATYVVKRPWWTVLWILCITIVLGYMMGRLFQAGVSTEYADMMPQDDPSIIEFNTIMEEYNATSTLYMVAEGDDQALRAFADEVIPQIEDMEQYVTDVIYQAPRDFIAEHALMLMKTSDLENSRTLFEDPNLVGFLTNLNDSFEKEYIQSEEKISNLEQEQGAVRFLDGIQTWVDEFDNALEGQVEDAGAAASEAILFGSGYNQSWDRRMMIFKVMTTFTIYDLGPMIDCPNAIDAIILPAAEKHGVDAGLTGSIILGRDKMEAISTDMIVITLLAIVGVLILFMVAFRMIVAPFLAIITLIFGVVWAMGLAWPLVGQLNILTAMMGAMLVGLGIDFSIHIIAVYTEWRARGEDVLTAMTGAMTRSGKGIITGAFTTAIAFMTLIFGKTDGMRQFGLVLGVGLLLTMVATLSILPTLLVLRERFWERIRKEAKPKLPRDISYRFLGSSAQWLSQRWIFSLVAVVIVVGFFAYRGFQLEMDYDSRNLLPKGLKSLELQDKMIEAFDMDPDNAMLTATSLEEAYTLTEATKDASTVGVVSSIVDLLPPKGEQEQRKALVADVRRTMARAQISPTITRADLDRLKAEVERLEDNVMEIQSMAFIGGQDKVYLKAGLLVGVVPDEEDPSMVALHERLNPNMPDITQGTLSALRERLNSDGIRSLSNVSRFHRDFAAAFKPAVVGMANTETLTVESLPPEIRDQYVGKSGQHFLIYVFARENIWNRQNMARLVNEMQKVSPRATGMPIIYHALLRGITADGRLAMQIALGLIFLLLLADFKNVWKALLAIVPLIFGVLLMLGVMHLSGMMLTLVGFYAVPIIIGIGIDDGVHIIHRYNVEGSRKHTAVFSSTGRAILLTSLTTMLAFGSLWFARFSGLSDLGIVLLIGVGACFVATVLVIPVLAGLGHGIADRRGGAAPETSEE